MKFLLILALCFASEKHISQSTEIRMFKNYMNFIVEWGFLENYHGALYSNMINNDSLFIDNVKKLRFSPQNSIDFSVLASSLDSICKLYNINNEHFKSYHYIPGTASLNNQKINSIIRTSPSLINKRVLFADSSFQVVFNDQSKSNLPYPDIASRLLALSKIWNNYLYYYPYRYGLPKYASYKNLLYRFVKKIVACANAEDYQLAIQEFCCSYPDSHSNASSFIISNYFGTRSIPAKIQYFQHKVIVNDLYSDSLFNNCGLQIGDIIQAINGEKILEILKRLSPYIASSNRSSYYRDVCKNAIKSNNPFLEINISRNGQDLKIVVPTFPINRLLDAEEKQKRSESLQYINDSSLLVRCKFIDTTILDSVINSDSRVKWIVFDLRSSTQWIIPVLEPYLFKEATVYCYYYYPLTNQPGRFSNYFPMIACKNGGAKFKDFRLIILVNENTQSQGEFQAMFLQAAKNSITIGRKTSGTDGNVSQFIVPGNITINMTSVGIIYADYSRTQNVGIKINIRTKVQMDNILGGNDLELEKAIEIIRKGGQNHP